MKTEFIQPEEEIIKEAQEADKFYFIVQGDCMLNLHDENFEYH